MQVQLSACPECFGFKQAFFGSEYCQEHNNIFRSWPAASRPVEYLKPSQWICAHEHLRLLLFQFFFFFFFMARSDGEEEGLSVNETPFPSVS